MCAYVFEVAGDGVIDDKLITGITKKIITNKNTQSSKLYGNCI